MVLRHVNLTNHTADSDGDSQDSDLALGAIAAHVRSQEPPGPDSN